MYTLNAIEEVSKNAWKSAQAVTLKLVVLLGCSILTTLSLDCMSNILICIGLKFLKFGSSKVLKRS